MELHIENEGTGTGAGQAVRYVLGAGEKVHLLHPKQIIAFRGDPRGRTDRFMDWKGMYRKRKLIQAELQGPCEVMAALPAGYCLKPLAISGGSDLLFEFRNLFSYTPGIRMEHRLLQPKKMLVTRDWMKLRLSGEGEVGLLTYGPVYEMELDEREPLFVDARSVVAMPENARLELCVYGNHLASQHMNYQWSMTGRGTALIQGGLPNRELEEELQGDGLVRRVLREVLPFGGVFIK
ncbi:AIM24 family protein [Gorillibacterium sp. sgz5001074]|uniref:AIM24 family protein n=1 Tax=Gorillibacterium sp. sgz5001074 TaxID=3446695 RepID=UPI003F664EF7